MTASRLARLLAPCAILLALLQAGWAAWRQDETYDERYHLEWSRRLIESGVTERVSLTRLNSKTPVSVPNALANRAARALGVESVRARRFLTRLPSLLWLALLLAVAQRLARELFGPAAALIALLALSLEPNLIAHASLVTSDLAFAAAGLWTLLAALRLRRAPSPGRGLVLGAALGTALVAKLSSLLLLPLLLLPPLALGGRLEGPDRRRFAAGALVALLAAGLLLNGAYRFREALLPIGGVPWQSPLMQRVAAAAPSLALPVPLAYLTGLDITLRDERGAWNVYALGRLSPCGVWYYFPLLWLLKTPLLLLIAQVIGLWRLLRSVRLPGGGVTLGLALALLLLLAYFSLVFRAQIGYRYVLLCVALAWLLTAGGLASLAANPRAVRAFALACLFALGENVFYLGDPIAFTNAAVQPKRQAFRLIADSNLDWGQNREKIQRYLSERGIRTRLDPPHILPGHNTFRLNALAGIWEPERYRFLREHADPGGAFLHTYLWFEVSDDLYNAYLNAERVFAPSPRFDERCPPGPSRSLASGDDQAFSVDEWPARKTTWLACVQPKKAADFGFRSEKGSIFIGHLGEEDTCQVELLDPGHTLWYRLEPGRHAFCVVEPPNRRPQLPFAFEGRFLAAGRRLELAIRQTPVLWAPRRVVPAAAEP